MLANVYTSMPSIILRAQHMDTLIYSSPTNIIRQWHYPLLQVSVLVSSGCHNKDRKLGDLNNKNVFSPSSGGRKSEIRVPEWLGAGESSLPGLQRAAFWLCTHLAFPDCVYIRKKRVLSPALLIRTPILSDENLTLMVSFNLITFKQLFPNTVTLEVRASTRTFQGTQLSPQP